MMQTRPLSVEEICNKLRPVLGDKIDDLYFRYTVAATKEEREDMEHMFNALYLKHLNALLDQGVLLEPPKEGVINGTYTLANIHYSGKNLYPFNLREEDWKRHVCITGMSGSGKTTLGFHVAETLNKHNKNFLIFDWKKSFRPLMNINSEMAIFTVGDARVTNLFKTNINKPPKGVAPKEWLNTLVDLLIESFFASFGVHKVLLETMDEAYKEWGVYEGSENYPNWKHIKWRLEEKQEKVEGREAGWLESAMRIATVLTFGEFGEVLNYKGEDAVNVEELLEKKVIMELNSLGNIEKKFFCEYLLTYIYKLKKAQQNEHNKKFDHAIIVDEAHNIFLKKPTNFANESVTDMIYREMREYGTGLICLDQHISKISDTVKGNSACVIAFQQQLPADIEDISHLMQLQENKHYFSQLNVGEAIVKLAERYKTPFLIQVPFPQTRARNVTDKEVTSRAQAVLTKKTIQKDKDETYLEQITNPKTNNTEQKTTMTKKEETQKQNTTQQTPIIQKTKQQTNIPLQTIGPSPLEQILTKKESPTQNTSTTKEAKKQAIITQKQAEQTIQEAPKTIIKQREIPPVSEIPSPPTITEKKPFSEVQEMIRSFVQAHLDQGVPLDKIEATLEKSKTQGRYTSNDIMRVINEFFSHSIEVKKETFIKEKTLPTTIIYDGLTVDEQAFMKFLQEHPEHTLSTVEVYRQIGLSARKGTVVKKALENKKLIRIKELRNNKGWKKIIRINDEQDKQNTQYHIQNTTKPHATHNHTKVISTPGYATREEKYPKKLENALGTR